MLIADMSMLPGVLPQRVSAVPSLRAVSVIDWPLDGADSTIARSAGELRLFVVAADAEPPEDLDERSDWVRLPVDLRDVHARVRILQRRASRGLVPVLDDHGILRRSEGWVALAPREARVIRAFLDAPRAVLGRRELQVAVWPSGVPNSRTLDGCIHRIRARIAPLGLGIRSVRRRGFMLVLDEIPLST